MRALDGNDVTSLIARDRDATVVGCTAIVTDDLSWSRHVGQLRVLVSPAVRGTGLGRALIQECFAQALERGLKKLVAQMTTDQGAAIAVFEELSFGRRRCCIARWPIAGRWRCTTWWCSATTSTVATRARQLYGLSDALDDANPR